MGKCIVGTIRRKEGVRNGRIYTVIQCDQCGTKTYARKQRKIEEALARLCRNCIGVSAAESREAQQLGSIQDKALIEAHRSIVRLMPKVNRRKTHGLSTGVSRRTYNAWRQMMDRCNNPKSPHYENYGKRGIRVCQRWHDVRNFFNDMGLVPDGYSLERDDVNGNYEPLNCRWIPKGKQSANRRNCYRNRNVDDADKFHKKKQKLIRAGTVSVDAIPFGKKKGLGWWREFGLYHNPYVYGPMQWKRNSIQHRREEAVMRGWHVPRVKKM